MDTENLKKYLEVLVDLEKNKYIQESTLKNISRKISDCKNIAEQSKKKITSNILQGNRTNISEESITVSKSGRGWALFAIYYFAVVGMGLFGVAFGSVFGDSKIRIILGIIGAVIGGGIPWSIWRNILKKRYEEERRKVALLRESDLKSRTENDLQIKQMQIAIPKLQKDYEVMKNTYAMTSNALNQYYKVGIIPVKYRNIVPVCTFYEYILNKRTYSLERNPVTADEGAINMYEEDVRWGKVFDKLDVIISQLNAIREEQEFLRDVIIEADRENRRLLNGINNNISGFRNEVNASLDVLKYQGEQSLKCQQYMASIAYERYMSNKL